MFLCVYYAAFSFQNLFDIIFQSLKTGFMIAKRRTLSFLLTIYAVLAKQLFSANTRRNVGQPSTTSAQHLIQPCVDVSCLFGLLHANGCKCLLNIRAISETEMCLTEN